MKKLRSLFYLVILQSTALYSFSPVEIPEYLSPYISVKESMIALKSSDLNSDGLEDYLFITEESKSGLRTFYIITTQSSGRLKLAVKNPWFVKEYDNKGEDPLFGVYSDYGSFEISFLSGKGIRKVNSFIFVYVPVYSSWFLKEYTALSYLEDEPNEANSVVYRLGKDFDLIDIADFDPRKWSLTLWDEE